MKHALPWAVGNGRADQVPEPRELQQHQQNHHDHGDKRQQKESAIFRHTLLNHPGGLPKIGKLRFRDAGSLT